MSSAPVLMIKILTFRTSLYFYISKRNSGSELTDSGPVLCSGCVTPGGSEWVQRCSSLNSHTPQPPLEAARARILLRQLAVQSWTQQWRGSWGREALWSPWPGPVEPFLDCSELCSLLPRGLIADTSLLPQEPHEKMLTSWVT